MAAAAFRFDLGQKVRDRVTGYTGIICARTEWLYGCRRYTVQSQEMKDGKPVDAMAFDEDGLDVVAATEPVPARATGGPRQDPGRGQTVSRS